MGNKLEQGDIGTCMILGGFIVMFLSLFLVNLMGVGGIVLCIIAGISVIIGLILILQEKKQDEDSHIANINMFQKEYDEYTEKLGIVKDNAQVTLYELDETCHTHLSKPHYIWADNGMLNIFPMAKYYIQWHISSMSRPDISELKLKSIPIDSILYFEEVGELRKYTTISGGGTSLKGALLGYAIADDIGAIIGSRESITTNVVSEDDRRIELIYKNQDGQIENLEFMHDAYDVFKKLIPLRELRRIISLNTVKGTKDETGDVAQDHQSVKDKLKQLKDLHAEGLITEDEFVEQKKKILEAI